MNEEFLVSKELFHQYELGTMEGCSYSPRELEPELEKERIEALCDVVSTNMLYIKEKFKTLIGRDKCIDCTSIIRENMSKLSESNIDIRNSTLETIFNKYVKIRKTEEENIFTEYMKRQVCADLPEAGKLIDLVYHKCRTTSNKDKLDTVNKVIYSSFLEYLKSKNLIVPNNTKGRVHSERASSYNVTTINKNGSDLCVKNTLKYNNTIMPCISEPGVPACFKYIADSNRFGLSNIRFITDLFPDECTTLSESASETHVLVKVCDIPDFLNVPLEIEGKRYMTVLDYISRDPLSIPEEPLVAYVLTNVDDSDSDFEIKVDVKPVSKIAQISNGNVSVSAELLSQTSATTIRNDLDRASIWISDDLNELMHSIFRKDHALEDLICLFLQFLAINPFPSSSDADNEGVLLMGQMVKPEVKDRMIKVAMAAILAPVKNTGSGFTVAPDIDTIATIAGEDVDTVADCIRDFAYAFGLEFFEGKTSQSVGVSEYFYNNIASGISSGNGLFQHINGILKNRYPFSWTNIIKPRLRKLMAVKAAKYDHAISVTEFIHAIALSWDEYLVMSDYMHEHTVIPAVSFYMSIFSTIAYIIGHKVASLLPYSIDNYCHRTNIDKKTKTKAIVYGMGPGLIHAIFEREAESNERSCPDVAIPITQYVMPVLNVDKINNMTRVNTYVNMVMNSVIWLELYLKRTSRFIKRSIRNISVSSSESIHIDLLENARKLPDFDNIRTIYISDPDCINVFAPGFRGIYKAGDRGRLENMFADARKKLEDIYYVIAARRPLVPEEYLEDDHHSVSMHMDADRQDYDTEAFANLYREVRAYLSIGSDEALANPDVSISSLDARPLQLGSVNKASDTTNWMDNRRYVIIMDTSDSTDLYKQRIAFCAKTVPYTPYISIISSICPSFKSIPIKGRRRGHHYNGLFVESKSWALADRFSDENYSWGVSPQLYQVTDRRDSDVRLPIIAIPEFSGAKMCEGITNNILNSASDISIRDEADSVKLNYSGFTQIPNKVTRITADSNYLPPHTNYRFLEAERRRWNLQKYPKYKSSSYIRNVKLCYEYSAEAIGSPYPSKPWQLSGYIASVNLTDYKLFVNGNSILDAAEGKYEKTIESKRRRLLMKASSNSAVDNPETKRWEQLWLERLLSQLNTISDENGGEAFRPMNYERRQLREIALSLHPEYRKSVSALAVHTIVDTEDISRSINIYAELIDSRDCAPAHVKSRMKIFAALIFNSTAPCNNKFLDAVNTDTAENAVEDNTTSAAQYSAICKTRELTEIATEIRVKAVKAKMDKELLELRQQKEEYCRKYREAMKSIRKQRKQLLDNRCFLNNKDAFTEEEKGIDSLYRQGQILGYKLILRDRSGLSSSSSGDGLSAILDMTDPDFDREHLCDRVAQGNLSVDLVALTAPIYIWCGAFIFSIGKVTINIRDVFDSVNIKPKFYNEDASLLVKYVKAGMEGDEIPNSISSLNIDAPHVRNHSACLGNLERNLNSASTEDDVLAYLDWCLQYLNTVNLGDLYGANLSYFPCVPATMHNIIKYGVLATGRLDERIGIWTGAGTNGERISPYSTNVVQPVWNIGNDLAMALWEDAKKKLEDDMFEGSDISENDLLNIALEISGQSTVLTSLGWKDSHVLFRDMLSYSLYKLSQDSEPNVTLNSGSRCVTDPSRFASNIRVGLRQKLQHRDFFTKRSIEFMNYIQHQNMRFSDIWKPGMNEDSQIHLKDVRNNRLNNYHINI